MKTITFENGLTPKITEDGQGMPAGQSPAAVKARAYISNPRGGIKHYLTKTAHVFTDGTTVVQVPHAELMKIAMNAGLKVPEIQAGAKPGLAMPVPTKAI